MRKAVGSLLRRAGIDVAPAAATTDARRARILAVHGIDLVLDVGANAGQYARVLRRSGYAGPIVSFEPHGEAFELLRGAAARDGRWEARRLALGDAEGEAVLHVGGNSETSSLLEVLPALEANPAWRPVARETVAVRRLDAVADEVLGAAGSPYLKLDVQGSELAVLAGARETLPRVRAVEAELALAPRYAGQPDYRAVIDALGAAGFELAYVSPGYFHWDSGHLVELDGIFVRAGGR